MTLASATRLTNSPARYGLDARETHIGVQSGKRSSILPSAGNDESELLPVCECAVGSTHDVTVTTVGCSEATEARIVIDNGAYGKGVI